MFKSFRQDGNDLELIDEEQFTLFKDKIEIGIKIGKTKTKKYLVIQAQYDNNKEIDCFQTKLTVNNLKEKSKHFNVASNIDESFILLVNLFEINEVWVKDILNKNYLKLVFNFQKKELEMNLPYKKNEKNIFIHRSQTVEEPFNYKNMNLNIDDNININEIEKGEKIDEIKEKENINNDAEKEKSNEIEKKEGEINNIIDNRIIKINENKNEINNKNKITQTNESEEDNNNIVNNILNNNEEKIIQEKNNNSNIINEESNEKNKENYNIIINNDKNNEDNEKENVKMNIIIKNNNKDIINNCNINKLLEKIKNLEEENKKLKEENNELKQKLLENDFNKDKLKKSEKEKENLKRELQKLKNNLNQTNNFDNRQNKISSNDLRQQSIILPSKNDLKINSKNIQKETKDIEEIENILINNIGDEQIEMNLTKKKFESKSPINLKIHKTITHSSYLPYSLDNTFDVFTSLKDELLLVYSTKIKSIECFDLIKHKFHKTILNAHNGEILTIRHYCPKYLNKDMILSGSNGDYSVKIWDIETWSCIFNINKIYEKGNMFSICILFDEFQKESFVFTSSNSDYIKMWDMNGKFIKNISKTNINEIFFIDTYYDDKEYKYYLISGEMKCVKSYELNLNQLFKTYIDNNSCSEHVSAFIYNQGDIARLVESEFYGTVRIWNFHTGNIIQKIDICRRTPLVSLCLWNENYLLVSCVDNTIKLVDFKNYALIKSFTGHNNEVCTIKKIIHPTYGECLFSQGLANEQIKMWING